MTESLVIILNTPRSSSFVWTEMKEIALENVPGSGWEWQWANSRGIMPFCERMEYYLLQTLPASRLGESGAGGLNESLGGV